MGGVTFLIMLAGFALVIVWYVSNLIKGENGTAGIFALKDEAAEESPPATSTSKLAAQQDVNNEPNWRRNEAPETDPEENKE